MSKKGATFLGLTIPPVFGTLLATALVMVALLWFVHGIGEQTTFQKRFLATDLALVMDALYAMPQPGALFMIYHPQRSQEFGLKYSYDFAKNKVVVSEKQDDARAGLAFFTQRPGMFFEERRLEFSESFIVPIITRQDEIISVRDVNKRDFSYSRDELVCAGPGVRKSYRAESLSDVGARLVQLLSGVQGITTAAGSPKLVISTTDSPVVKAYVNGNTNPSALFEAQRIGCEIVNKVRAYLEGRDVIIDETGVIPVNPLHTSSKDDNVLVAGDVLLVIGSQSQELDFQRGIANAIKEGLVNAQS